MIRLSEKWFEAQIYRGNVRFYSLSRWRFFPPPPPPFPLSLSYSVRHDGSRFRSYTKIRTRSILRSKLIEFFRDSISRIIRRQVFNELLCTSRFRNLSINHHPRKRGLYTAHEIKVWTGRIDGINLRQSTPPPLLLPIHCKAKSRRGYARKGA